MVKFSEGDYCFYEMKACVIKSIDEIQGSCSVFIPAKNLVQDNVDIKNLHPIQLRYTVSLFDNGSRYFETMLLGFTKKNKKIKVEKPKGDGSTRYFISVDNKIYKHIDFIHELQHHFRDLTGSEMMFDKHWTKLKKLLAKNAKLG